MKTSVRLLAIGLTLATLGGCGVSPKRMTQSYNSIDIELSGRDEQRYRLVDQRGQVYARATGERARLSFAIPAEAPADQCFRIVNQKDQSLLKKPDSFSPSVRDDYVALLKKYEDAAARYEENKKTQDDARKRIAQARSSLSSNRAWTNASCSVPYQRPYPEKPATRCDSRDECLQEAGAMCFTRFLGAEGCSMAISQLNVSGILASPACGAMAAQLAEEEYGLGDAFVDAFHGAVDDWARDKVREGGFWNTVVGSIGWVTNKWVQVEEANACTTRIFQREYAPLERWLNDVAYIQSEPQQLYRSCSNDHSSLQTYSSRLSVAAANQDQLRNNAVLLDKQLTQLEAKREPLSFCRTQKEWEQEAKRSKKRR